MSSDYGAPPPNLRDPSAAAEVRNEHGRPAEAEAILHQLASAFFFPTQTLHEHSKESEAQAQHLPEPEAQAEPTREAALLVADAFGLIQSVGGSLPALLAAREDALLGTAISRYFPDEVPSQSRRVRALKADGRAFEADVTVLPITGTSLTSYAVRDLSDERARAAASKRAEARYRSLVEQIPAVTFMASLEEGENEIYIGPQIEALLGYTQKEWLDDPVLWFHRMHADDQARWNAEFARGCAVGGPFRADCRFFAKNGRTVWVHGEARVVRDQLGRPLFIQGVAFDITDIKEAEQRMREAQEALLRTEKLAAIGRLAASIGHELRNPLAAIRNAWFYLERKVVRAANATPDPRVLQFSQVITTEIDRCAKIIGELLDFSRERAIYRVPAPVSELVQSAIEVVVKPAPAIMLENAVSPDLPVPNLDADQFRQVLVNLLQNAVEAVEAETGRVEVGGDVNAGLLRLTVRDNGKGMPAEVRARIFEPLYTTKLRGTGLGLAIVEGIVKRHGGQIEVTSELGRGTTFSMTVPIGEASLEPAPALGGAADLRTPRGQSG